LPDAVSAREIKRTRERLEGKSEMKRNTRGRGKRKKNHDGAVFPTQIGDGK